MPEIPFTPFLGISLMHDVEIIFNLPPFQLPPVIKTKDGQFEISLEIVGIEIYVLRDNWQDALTNYAQQIKIIQLHPRMQKLFYGKNGTLKPRKS